MKIRRQSSQSGIALIMVMIVIVVLAGLAGLFAYNMKVETTLARRSSFEGDMEWMGRSGVELAKYVLAQSGNGPGAQADFLDQKWAGGTWDTNLADLDLEHYKLGGGEIKVTIEDQDRKFNINMADDVILRQALTLVGVDAGTVPTIVDSIRDWIDPDDNPGMSGAEDSHYRALDPPTFCKNGPIDDISELLYINGITYEMYKGSDGVAGGARMHQSRDARRSQFEQVTYATGLVKLFTATSGRLVNINTASAEVLQVFPMIDENIASAIIGARHGPDGMPTPFRSPQELGRVPGMNTAAIAQFARFFSVRSLIFEVNVKVTVGNASRNYKALLRRNNPRDIQVLSMYWES